MAEFVGDLGLRVAPSHSGNKDRAIPIEAALIDVLHEDRRFCVRILVEN